MDDHLWDYRNPYEWMRRIRSSSMPPLIICCALTGGIVGKESNPNLPESAEEQAEQTYEAYRAGAAEVHIHARNPREQWISSGETEVYRNVNALVREKCPDIIINNTTGSLGLTIEQRMASLDAGPELASLNLGPFVLNLRLKARKDPLPSPRDEVLLDQCIPLSYGDIAVMARRMKEKGIKPEMELFHPGMYWVMHDLIDRGLLEPPYLVQFVLGFQTSSYPTPKNLLSLLDELPPQSMFQVIGVGPFQLPMTVMGMILGGHVRVGMEDNQFYRRGQPVKSNAELVERAVRMAKDMNREVATPAQARSMMGLSQIPSKYS